VIATCLDKWRAQAVAERCGVPVLAARLAASSAELARSARELGAPLVLKRPSSDRSILGHKALLCRSDGELGEALGQLATPEDAPTPNEPVLVQRLAEGHRRNCHFAAREGRVLAYFEQKVVRTDTANGTGYGVEGVSEAPTEELRRHVNAMAAELRYTGVGCVQFMVSEDLSKLFFLEVNPRLDATCALACACGVDFPRLAAELALGAPGAGLVGEAGTPYPVGVRAHWLGGDLLGLVRAMRWKEVTLSGAVRWMLQLLRALLSSRVHLTWDVRDPMPSVYLYLYTIPRGLVRAVHRSSRHLPGVRARAEDG
jgi:hypothetical protein